MRNRKLFRFTCFRYLVLILALSLIACADMFEERCSVSDSVNFVYLNENNKDETSLLIGSVVDYIFNSDSILFRVDSGIVGDRIRSRSFNLPDGNWHVLSFANVSINSDIPFYTVGRTHMRELYIDVIAKDLLKSKDPDYIGNSDNLFFSALQLDQRNGQSQQQITGYYTPAHAQLTVFVTWAEKEDKPLETSKLAAVLDGVSGGCMFLSDKKIDNMLELPYAVPSSRSIEKSQRILLYPSEDSFRFDAVSMRFETGKAPHLQLMMGTSPLTKSLDLNRFFNENQIDLSNTRIQNFRLSIRIEKHKVVISPIDILAWDVEYI